MFVFGINGSPRKDGNTALMFRQVFNELEKQNITTELFQLSGQPINGCIACYRCFSQKNKRCAITEDCVNSCIEKMEKADAIILGTPTYFADCTAQIKALIDRSGLVARANGDMFARKIGAAIVAVRRAGAIHAFDSLNHFFLIGQMIVVGSSYWNIGIGRNIGEVENDHECLATMTTLAKNISWVLSKLSS